MKKKLDMFQMFNRLTNENMDVVASYVEEVHFNSGDYVFKQGDENQDVFFLIKGKIKIQLEDDGNKVFILSLNSGDYFGELAFINDNNRSASALCVENCQLYRFDPKCLNDLKKNEIDIYTKILENLLKFVANKIHDTDIRLLNLKKSENKR